MAIINRSNKVVKKIRAQVLQCIDVCLFEHGTYKTAVASIDSTSVPRFLNSKLVARSLPPGVDALHKCSGR